MANGDPLPNPDRIARACGSRTDKISGAQAAAFAPRSHVPAEITLGKISVDWVECVYDVPERRNVQGSLHRLKERKLGPQPVAILPVSGVRRIHRNGHALDTIEDGHGDDVRRCHSAIVGFTGEPIDLELQDALAKLANSNPLEEIT